jgi:hypothetical protein
MKRCAILALGLAACSTPPARQGPPGPVRPAPARPYVEEVLADGPIVHLPFNEASGTAVTPSAGAHAAVLKGGATPGRPSGHKALGTCVELDGETGRVQVKAHRDFRAIGAGPYTIELWFKATRESRGDLVNYKGEDGANDLGVFSCLGGPDEVSHYEALDHRARAREIALGLWHHLVVTRDASMTIRLYVDGVEHDQGTGEMSWDFDADLLFGSNHVGADTDRISFPFQGAIDEVAVYAKALTAERVAEHFRAGTGHAAQPLRRRPVGLPMPEPPSPPTPPDSEGFTALFNGRDFSGLRFYFSNPNHEPAKTFRVEDGAIVCTGEPAGFIYTARPFRNFTLRYEWRFKRPAGLKDDAKFGGNSGCLLYLSDFAVLGVWPRSVEVQGMNRDAGQILPIPRSLKCRHEEFREARKTKPVGEWNQMEIVAKDGAGDVFLNGAKVAAFRDCELREGPIGWQSEGAEIHWRNVRIREDK